MARKSYDFDSVFKTLKVKHKNLFIPIINQQFGKNYSKGEIIELLPTDGQLSHDLTATGEEEIKVKFSDFLLKIRGDVYLLECQSYEDGAMAIRIAEYAFISASQRAVCEDGRVIMDMPRFAVIYIRSGSNTPKRTEITFRFPNGTDVKYDSENIFIQDYSREELIEREMYPFIPFYLARYEDQLKSGDSPLDDVINDLHYFRNELEMAYERRDLDPLELKNLKAYVNTIITHFTDGNQAEERLVKIMNAEIIETEADRIHARGIRIGEARGISIGEARGEARGISIGETIGETTGREQGLFALVTSLREFVPSAEEILSRIVKNEAYKNTTLEQVKQYMN